MSITDFLRKPASVDATLEENLAILARHGQVRLSMGDDGKWHAAIKLYVRTPGAKFEVSTDFKQETPAQAVLTLLGLTLRALTTIGETE